MVSFVEFEISDVVLLFRMLRTKQLHRQERMGCNDRRFTIDYAYYGFAGMLTLLLGFSYTDLLTNKQELFDEGINFTLAINFNQSKTNDTVSVFETTIRYVGGMLSAYELGGKKDERLVQKAQGLADKLICGWVGSNDLPYNDLNFTTNQPLIHNVSIPQAVASPL